MHLASQWSLIKQKGRSNIQQPNFDTTRKERHKQPSAGNQHRLFESDSHVTCAFHSKADDRVKSHSLVHQILIRALERNLIGETNGNISGHLPAKTDSGGEEISSRCFDRAEAADVQVILTKRKSISIGDASGFREFQ